jgi:hypothetical protein
MSCASERVLVLRKVIKAELRELPSVCTILSGEMFISIEEIFADTRAQDV